MTEELKLSSAGEEAWTDLLRRMEWAEGFSLIFLFSSSPALCNLILDRLRRIYQVKVSYVQEVTPQTPGTAVGEIMSVVGQSSAVDRASQAPLFIALHLNKGADWDDVRASFLQRLNERREILRNNLRRPVLIALPGDFRLKVMTLAPDLWAVRDFTINLDPDIDRQPTEVPASESREYSATSSTGGDLEIAHLEEWDRLRRAGATGRDLWVAGVQAIDAGLALRKLDRAQEIAEAVLKLARSATSRHRPWRDRLLGLFHGLTGPNPIPDGESAIEAARDLSVSLNRVGDVAGALGNLTDAQQAYGESLQISRQLRQRLGDSPEVLRDLSVSLDRVGDVARALGNLTDAQQAYGESLQISRQLRQRLGDSPEVLRDLSVSLDRVGDVARALGSSTDAQQAYGESLQIRRQLRQRLGDSPEVLRDLSVSLDRVGDVARESGDRTNARAAFEEALLLLQRLTRAVSEDGNHERMRNAMQKKLDEILEAEAEKDSTNRS